MHVHVYENVGSGIQKCTQEREKGLEKMIHTKKANGSAIIVLINKKKLYETRQQKGQYLEFIPI